MTPRWVSAASEQPLDVGELELDIGRAAMIALPGIRRRFHLAQQRVHLLGLEPPPGAPRAVTGHGGRDLHEPAFERQRLVPFGHVLGEIADEPGAVDLAKERRRLAQRHPARPERFEDKYEAG